MRRFSIQVLQSMADLEEAYAVSIARNLRQDQGRSISMARVLSVLKTMEETGLIRSVSIAGSEKRNGNRKRIYSLTRWGLHHLESGQFKEITEERQYFYKSPGFNSA